VTAIKNLSLLPVEGKGMLGVSGIAARTFGAVARSQVSVMLISQASSEQSICFATPGIVGRLFSALGNNGVNIIAIAQGSSECSISLVVDGGGRGPHPRFDLGVCAPTMTTLVVNGYW